MGKSVIFTVINDLRSDQRMEKICGSLQSAGYLVTLLGRELPDSPALKKQPYQQVRLKCIFTKGKLFYAEYNLRLWFWLRKNIFDIYSAVDMDTLWPVISAGKKWNKPVVFDAHEYFSEVPEVIHRASVHRFWKYWEQKWIPQVQAAYTVSGSLAKIFSEKYKIPFSLIRNVPRYLKPEIHMPAQEKFILYQGALNKGRGLESLIEAMQNIPCILKIAGEGDLSSSLRARVQELKLEDKVFFLGFIPPSELKFLTQQAYIGYNVSEPLGQSYYYSLNNKYFDYIMAGLPSVINDFPEYRAHEAEYETGVLIESAEVKSIIEACSKLLSDTELYIRLRNNCLKAAAVWNWEEEEKKILKIYENLPEQMY